MEKVYIAIVIVALMGASAFAGYNLSERQHADAWAKYQAQLSEQTLKAEQSVRETENAYESKLRTAQRQGKEAVEAVRRSYELKLRNGRAAIAERLHDGGQGSACDLSVSDSSANPGRAERPASGSAGSDGAKFQRLYEGQLRVARDCDVKVTACKSFLDFYRGLVDGQ